MVMHQCHVCMRLVPIAPGSTCLEFVIVPVAHFCLGGTLRFHRLYETEEQDEHLNGLMDDLTAPECASCGDPLDIGTHPFCRPMDMGS